MATFITQVPRNNLDDYPTDEIGELEALVSGVTQTSQSTLLLKKRKEMREVDDALDFMKEEFASRMQACEERQREFERKQADMKDQVTKFEKFIQENDAKRQRAEMKAKSETRQCQQNELKISQLRRELHKDEESKKKKNEELERLKKYRMYLDIVVEVSEEEYEEITEVLNRYNTLMHAYHDLQAQVTQGEQKMDVYRGKLLALKRETQNQVLVHNSEIHGHQKDVERLRSDALQLDIQRENLEQKTNDRNRQSGQVVMSIKNLYMRCLSSPVLRTKASHVEENGRVKTMKTCLDFIGERIMDLQDIAQNPAPYPGREAAGAGASKTPGQRKKTV